MDEFPKKGVSRSGGSPVTGGGKNDLDRELLDPEDGGRVKSDEAAPLADDRDRADGLNVLGAREVDGATLNA